MFAEFEKIIHAIEESGDALTLDVFRSQYRGLLEAYLLKTLCWIPSWIWNACASRIFTMDYVYKYATGISAAVALSQRCLLASRGVWGSVRRFSLFWRLEISMETLKVAGVDMTTSAPIESTLRLFEQRLDDWKTCCCRPSVFPLCGGSLVGCALSIAGGTPAV